MKHVKWVEEFKSTFEQLQMEKRKLKQFFSFISSLFVWLIKLNNFLNIIPKKIE